MSIEKVKLILNRRIKDAMDDISSGNKASIQKILVENKVSNLIELEDKLKKNVKSMIKYLTEVEDPPIDPPPPTEPPTEDPPPEEPDEEEPPTETKIVYGGVGYNANSLCDLPNEVLLKMIKLYLADQKKKSK